MKKLVKELTSRFKEERRDVIHLFKDKSGFQYATVTRHTAEDNQAESFTLLNPIIVEQFKIK